MTIKRIVNGTMMEFELTPSEMLDAYEEKNNEYRRYDIEAYLELELGNLIEDFDDALTEEQIKDLIPAFVDAYTDAIDDGAFEWWPVVSECVNDCIEDYLTKRGDWK